MVDTCAAEFQAQTPYFYATYDEHCDARNFPRTGRDTVIVLGSGPIRIGQGIEFDYSSVHCVQTLKELGYDVVIINQGEECSFEEDLAKDVLEIITVFSARLYGSRSKKNHKLLQGMKAAVESAEKMES